MKILDIQQNTPEWEAIRKTKVGASDANIIMERSPFGTPYQLWQQKLNLVPKREMTPAMNRGVILEEEARKKCEIELGILFFPMVALHDKNEWMIASFDGIDPEGKQIVEIKCPNAEDHLIAFHGGIPNKYYAQLQHQMEVAEVDEMNYYSFDGKIGVLVKVYRNDKFIKEMILKEQQFYECIQEFIAPEMVDKDFIEITDNKWIKTAEEYKIILEKEEEILKRKEILRSELIAASQGKNVIGNGVKVSRITRKGTIDYSKIPELQGKDLNAYRKPPINSWRISC